ncbi:unnamed protein product [Choristocarpus tenellus]
MRLPSLPLGYLVACLPTIEAFSIKALSASHLGNLWREEQCETASNNLVQTSAQRRQSLTGLQAGRKGESWMDGSAETMDRLSFLSRLAAGFAGASGLVCSTPDRAWSVGNQPGERTTPPPTATLLVPSIQAKIAVERMCVLLEDPRRWKEAKDQLQLPPLSASYFKASFRTYSDADEEQHLVLDLYRIQAQDSLKAR